MRNVQLAFILEVRQPRPEELNKGTRAMGLNLELKVLVLIQCYFHFSLFWYVSALSGAGAKRRAEIRTLL